MLVSDARAEPPERGSADGTETVHDVVVYGGTSSGVVAAVQARRMGKSVVLIEPSHRLGGLSSGGLGQTDIGNKAAIGGLARQFYQAVREHYANPAAWKWQRREEYMDSGQTRTAAGEDAMWTFEPSVALKIFEMWVKDHQVEVAYGERLDRRSGVALTRSIPWRILSVRMESGRTFRGRVFIDATYEGDLMAAANVSYTIGREANSVYGETLNGVQTRYAKYHQFAAAVDPYVEKGTGIVSLHLLHYASYVREGITVLHFNMDIVVHLPDKDILTTSLTTSLRSADGFTPAILTPQVPS